MLVDHSVILSPESKRVPHACRDVSRILHAYESMWNVSYLMMWIMWLREYVGRCVHDLCLLFGDTCTLMMMLITSWWFHLMMIYFGDGDNMWIIYTWLDDLFDDDHFLVHILDMMIAFVWNIFVRTLFESLIEVHAFVVMLSLLVKNVIGGDYVSGSLSNIISEIQNGTTRM